MVVMVPRQYFQLMNCEGSAVQRSPENIIFASCRSIGSVSWFLVGLAVVPQFIWQENLPSFCRVRRLLTYCLHIVAELIVSAINNLKTMDGGHAVHERQAILSTTVVISIYFVWRKTTS